VALNRTPRQILSVKGRSMLNRLNLKQVAPTKLGGSGITQLGGEARGKESLGKANPNSSRSTVPDAPGGSTRTNAAGKRAGGRDTTSTG
jgi:hypothetical protein